MLPCHQVLSVFFSTIRLSVAPRRDIKHQCSADNVCLLIVFAKVSLGKFCLSFSARTIAQSVVLASSNKNFLYLNRLTPLDNRIRIGIPMYYLLLPHFYFPVWFWEVGFKLLKKRKFYLPELFQNQTHKILNRCDVFWSNSENQNGIKRRCK